MISLLAMPGAEGLFLAKAETASRAISDDVSKPMPNKMPIGYIWASRVSLVDVPGEGPVGTFHGRSISLKSGLARREMHPSVAPAVGS